MDAELSRPDWLATVQSGRKQVQSRVCTPSFNDTTSRVDWDKLSVAEKATYVNNTDTILSYVRVAIEAICCKDVNCENESHRNVLDIFDNELVGAMSAASDQLKHKRTSFSAVKNVLFRTFCTPLYTCQLWFRYTARSLHKL